VNSEGWSGRGSGANGGRATGALEPAELKLGASLRSRNALQSSPGQLVRYADI